MVMSINGVSAGSVSTAQCFVFPMFRTKVDNTPKRRNVFAQLVVGSGTVGRVSHVHFTPMCTLNSDAERAAGCQLERAAQRMVSSVFFFFSVGHAGVLRGLFFFYFFFNHEIKALA